jgi:putative oxidoreductase
VSLGLVPQLAACAYRLALLAFGGLFIYAALLKIGAPQDFADAIASYRLLPDAIVNLVALGLPLFELACGMLLLTPRHCTTGLLSVISLLGIFLAALLSAVARNLPVNCGCFGAATFFDASPGVAFARDLGLLLCAILAYRYELTRDSSTATKSRFDTREMEVWTRDNKARNPPARSRGKKVASRDGV